MYSFTVSFFNVFKVKDCVYTLIIEGQRKDHTVKNICDVKIAGFSLLKMTEKKNSETMCDGKQLSITCFP